jgi:tRNA 2-selenouridine synthase
MIRTIEPTSFHAMAGKHPVIDVRSPGEFAQGHVPGAVSLPLFDDLERAQVGTLFVKSGRSEAIIKGLDLALPRIDAYLESLGKVCPPGKILLHCWRGGLRSAMMAEVFSRAGYHVHLLEGGYKAWRRAVREELGLPANIIVLGGLTGIGKTEILQAIARAGEQVVDLERLACHRGSVFGALGQPPQPTNEQFENDLWLQWHQLEPGRPVWLEDESRMIGRVTLPDPLVGHIGGGMLIRAELSQEVRIERLVSEYAGFDPALLADAILKISERLGGTRTSEALSGLQQGRFAEVASIALAYYDKAYQFSSARRSGKLLGNVRIAGRDADEDAARILDFYRNALKNGTNLPGL